ncbi:MAG: hypothetical protein K2N29_06380, partial [Ruminiclostridium sp.]|nr:hypothetical protein [Ruminiclostridium sp.]
MIFLYLGSGFEPEGLGVFAKRKRRQIPFSQIGALNDAQKKAPHSAVSVIFLYLGSGFVPNKLDLGQALFFYY